MPRSSKAATLVGSGDAPGRGAQQLLGHAAHRGVGGDVEVPERRLDLVQPDRVVGQPGPVDQALLDEDRHQRGQAPRVGAGPHGEVDVGQLRGLAAPRVDDDQRPLGIPGDLLERRPGVRDAVGLPRVLADEERDLRVLDVAPDHGAEHRGVDPELAGLLLGEARSSGSGHRAPAGSPRCRRRRGGSPGRRRRSRRSTRRRARRAPRRSRAATSAMAVSQSISSNVPSGRRRSGLVSRWRPFW